MQVSAWRYMILGAANAFALWLTSVEDIWNQITLWHWLSLLASVLVAAMTSLGAVMNNEWITYKNGHGKNNKPTV